MRLVRDSMPACRAKLWVARKKKCFCTVWTSCGSSPPSAFRWSISTPGTRWSRSGIGNQKWTLKLQTSSAAALTVSAFGIHTRRHRLNDYRQFTHVHRLDPVDVGPRVQARDAISQRASCGQHDDAQQGVALAQSPYHLQAILPRQAQIQYQHAPGAALLHGRVKLGPNGKGAGHHATARQVEHQIVEQIEAVFDDGYCSFVHVCSM